VTGNTGDADDQGTGDRKKPGVAALSRSGFIEYDRVLFFSDAVFAIAITLLAVNLHVPRIGAGTAHLLRQELPDLRGFGISFAVIGLFWLGHHGLFRYIVALDRPLIGLNLLFLGTIAFLPYPTEVLSASRGGSASVIFYAACAAAAGITELAVWIYATHAPAALTQAATPHVRLNLLLRLGRGPAVFLASIPVALVAPRLATYLWILIWILGIAINRIVPRTDVTDRIG
jgi:uncharacterized membrane protein